MTQVSSSNPPSLAPWLGTNTPVIGTLTVLPLPGSNRWQGDAHRWVARVEQDALALATGSVDAILVDYSERSSTEPFNPAAAVLLTQAVGRIRQLTGKPVGLSVGLSSNTQAPAAALALAWGSGATFLRIHAGVGGLMTPNQAWSIPAEAVAILANVSTTTWLPHTASSHTPALLEVATALLESFKHLPAGVPKGWVCQQTEAREAALSVVMERTQVPLLLEASDDPMACARMAPHTQGILLSSVIEKSTPLASPQESASLHLSPGIDVPKLEHWVRGLQHTWLSSGNASQATCQPIPQPLSESLS